MTFSCISLNELTAMYDLSGNSLIQPLVRDISLMVSDIRWQVGVCISQDSDQIIAAVPFRWVLRGAHVPYPMADIINCFGESSVENTTFLGGSGVSLWGAWVADSCFLSEIPGLVAHIPRCANSSTIIAANTPRDQVSWFVDSLGLQTRQIEDVNQFAEFDLTGFMDISQWLIGQKAKVRQTIRQDLKDREFLSGSFTVNPCNWDYIEQHIPLFLDVVHNNGESRPEALVKQELRQFISTSERSGGQLICFEYSETPTGTIGLVLAEKLGHVLNLAYIGLRKDAANRREVYANLMGTVPLEFSFSNQITRVLLGCSHVDVKRRRGAQIMQLCHLIWKMESDKRILPEA